MILVIFLFNLCNVQSKYSLTLILLAIELHEKIIPMFAYFLLKFRISANTFMKVNLNTLHIQYKIKNTRCSMRFYAQKFCFAKRIKVMFTIFFHGW